MRKIQGDSHQYRAREGARPNETVLRRVIGLAASAMGSVSVIETPDRIKAIEARPGYWLSITYADGREISVDLGDVIRRGGAFKPLQDQRLFARVKVDPLGNRIEWPEPKDEHGEPLISIDARSFYRAFNDLVERNYRERPS